MRIKLGRRVLARTGLVVAVASLCAVGATAVAYSSTSDIASRDHGRDDGLDFPALTELVPLTELPVLPELPGPTHPPDVVADPDDGEPLSDGGDDADSGSDSDDSDSDDSGSDDSGSDDSGSEDSDGADSDGADSDGDDGDGRDDSDGSGHTDRDGDGATGRDDTGIGTDDTDTDAGRSSDAADDLSAFTDRADGEAALAGGYEADAPESDPRPGAADGADLAEDVVPGAGAAPDREETGAPAGPPPAAVPPAAAAPVADAAPHRADVAVIAFTGGLPSPPEISWAPGPVLQSLLLAPVLVILLAVAAGALSAPARLPSALTRALEAASAVRRRLTGAAAAAVAGVGGVLYAVLQPSFGFDGSSLALVVGMLLALVLGAAAQEGSRLIYVDRWWGIRGRLVPVPGLVVLAVVSTLLSQALRIEPGLLLGSLVAYRSARRLRTDEEGQAAAVSAACLATVGLLAWSLRDPLVAAAGPTGAFLPEVLATMCTALPVLAAGNLVLATIPMATLAGGALLRWSRPLWVAFALAGAFALLHLVLRPGTEADAFVGEGVLVTLLLVAYLLTVATVISWSGAARPSAPTADSREPVG